MEELKLPCRNSRLFSGHFLTERLPTLPDWDIGSQELESVHAQLRDLFAAALPSTSESALEEELIRPILSDILGFSYLVQPSRSIFKTHRKPDYALFPDEETKQAAKTFDGEKKLFEHALAVADAKAWDVDLDAVGPASQMHDYILLSGVRWAVITNGRRWRLYHRDTVHELDTFYEVDLESLVAAEDPAPLKYFLVFFKADSFIAGAFLDRTLAQRIEAAQRIGTELKENVFEALRLLSQGFLDGNESLSPKDLPEIHENGLILLYRILFLLYAESEEEKELLPLSNPSYREQFSMYALKHEIASRDNWLEESHALWPRLKDLFEFVNRGNPHLGIYEYNGGLFSSNRYPFLEQHQLGDCYLADAIRLLACTQEDGHPSFFDYATLDVRELGSIYEGLLDHTLVLKNGTLEWQKDSAERKKTGSYYTPEYIVSYIVENTLGPLVDEVEDRLRDELSALDKRISSARGEERNLLQQKKEKLLRGARERVLNLKILDPAMGSGHFLVSACDYLARRIAELESALTKKETEEAVPDLKRAVAVRSLYGVDLNPMATELAKLSLWLHTVAKGKPLSFLDHHLRTGNSLIGATRKDLTRPPSGKSFEIGLWESKLVEDLGKAIRHLGFIKSAAGDSRSDIQAKKEEWALVNAWVGKYKQAADVWLSPHFGNELADAEYSQVIEAAAGNAIDKVKEKPFFMHAQEIAEEKRFFHWELEFPDVFFDQFGRPLDNPGFDAVIGNPPYGANRNKDVRQWSRQRYRASGTTLDNFALFLERATQLTIQGGIIGEIVPSGWLTAREHLPLRTILLFQTCFQKIVHMPYDVFPEAYIDTVVWISRKAHNKLPCDKTTVLVKRFGHREKVKKMPRQPEDYQAVESSEWLSDSQKLIITDTGAGQWLSQWMQSSHFAPIDKLVSVSRGITPFVKAKPKENRLTALGFFGSVDRYALDVKEFAPVVYESSLAEYKPIKFFTGPRLIIRRIISRQHRIHATLVREEFIVNKSSLPAIATSTDYTLAYVLALINSKLASLAFVARSEIAKRDDFPQLDIATVREFPIRRIAFTTPKDARAQLVEDGKEMYFEALEKLALEGPE